MGLAAAERFALRLGRLGSESLTQLGPLRLARQCINHERVGRLPAAGGKPGDAALKIVWKLQTGCGHVRILLKVVKMYYRGAIGSTQVAATAKRPMAVCFWDAG